MHWLTHWHHWDLLRQWIGSLSPVVALGAFVVPYWHNSKDRRREQATHLYCGHSIKYQLALPGDGIPNGRSGSDGVRARAIVPQGSSLSQKFVELALEPDADLPSIQSTLHQYAERVKIELYSTSDEPFFNINVWVTGKEETDILAVTVPQLKPKAKLRRYVYFDPGTLPITPLRIRFEFQDANGRSWQRIGSNPVKRLRRRTPVHTTDSSQDSISVRVKPKPNFYGPGGGLVQIMNADEIAKMIREANASHESDR